jgi:hypothetical protein
VALLCSVGESSTAASLGDAAAPTVRADAAQRMSGIQRDTAYFLGYQFVAVGTISLWPQEKTNYSNKIGFDRWFRNVTNPHWDSDSAFVNYALHPYWGASYYIRARERGLARDQSFWYSALLSTIFEFGAEAMVERVSLQDLVVTPVLGSLLGEYVFSPLRAHIRSKPGPLSPIDQAGLVLTDPLGSINSAVERVLGLETHLSLRPTLSSAGSRHRSAAPAAASQGQREKVGWRLELQVSW